MGMIDRRAYWLLSRRPSEKAQGTQAQIVAGVFGVVSTSAEVLGYD